MSLEVLLLRHAKSRWDEGVEDHERTLAARGIEAAGRIGRLVADRQLVPDLILCSTAVRATRTLELAAAAWPGPMPETRLLRNLYLAEPPQLLTLIREQPQPIRRLMLVGHNQGLEIFARWLSGKGEPLARRRLALKFPTGALAHFTLEGSTWSTIDAGQGSLVGFYRPRDLG